MILLAKLNLELDLLNGKCFCFCVCVFYLFVKIVNSFMFFFFFQKRMAPEQLHELSYSTRSDVWSLACIAYELMARRIPWAEDDIPKAIYRIMSHELLVMPPETPPALLALTARCWAWEPHDRPSMAEVVNILGELFYFVCVFVVIVCFLLLLIVFCVFDCVIVFCIVFVIALVKFKFVFVFLFFVFFL